MPLARFSQIINKIKKNLTEKYLLLNVGEVNGYSSKGISPQGHPQLFPFLIKIKKLIV